MRVYKAQDPVFLQDIYALITPDKVRNHDANDAFYFLRHQFLPLLEGAPWKLTVDAK
ncbi:MAG: hypothetical protein DHS20C10_03190 [marine bacterium B5-7]|nr:MAG: hypothetical protein DHS20C10_03190 [marine bacterium B5-7]